MTPAERDGLRGGFLKRTMEEEAEPEHLKGDAQIKMKEIKFAGDAALSLALDRGSVRTTDKDGHLHISEANVCKECVSPYRGSEVPGWKELGLDPERVYQFYRAGGELKKAAATINGKPLVRVHKPTSAEDHQYWDTVGAVGTTARWEAPYVKNGLTVWTAPDIAAIESGEKRELSPGYRWKPVMEPGAFEGKPFDGLMTEILFNHLCLVEDGRQGDDIVVGDSKEEAAWAAIEDAILAASH